MLAEIWQRAVAALESRPECERFPRWFQQNLQGIMPEVTEEGVLLVRLPSQLTREWLDRKFRTMLEEILSELLDSPVQLRIEAAEAPARSRRKPAASRAPKPAAAEPDLPAARAPDPRVIQEKLIEVLNCTPLNPRYTFSSLVTGENNQFAHAAATAVADAPGASYNPLFVHGGVGLGKTHLMHAIGQQVQERRPSAVVAYLSGEAFTTSFVSALRDRQMEEFRRLYRHVDIWLVDDIQFIASKERTSEEFFHTFNALYDTGRQVVICSDRPPHELQIMDERMVSRFEAGLVADISAPSYETRLAILERKAEGEGAALPHDVLEMMARMIRSNIRVLEGALIRLLAHSSFSNLPISLQMATSLLSRYFDEGARKPVRVETVQRVVCNTLNVPLEALMGKKRDRHSLLARQLAMYLSRELTESSLEQIGQLFGGKDHSTIAHACRAFKKALETDPETERLACRVRDRIRRSK